MHSPDQNGLRAAEQGRRQAMLDADTAALTAMLAASLTYVHSTGAQDSRDSYVAQLASGELRYTALAFDDLRLRLLGATGLVNGVMKATVLRGGIRREIASAYLAVWVFEAGGWVLHAVQGSALPLAAVKA
jgi:hypothetical protein